MCHLVTADAATTLSDLPMQPHKCAKGVHYHTLVCVQGPARSLMGLEAIVVKVWTRGGRQESVRLEDKGLTLGTLWCLRR